MRGAGEGVDRTIWTRGYAAGGARPAILAPMRWLSDNHVWLAAAIVGAIILASLVVLAISALRLWRSTRTAMRTTTAAATLLAAEADRMNVAVGALPDRQAELTEALVDLRARAEMLGVLGGRAQELLAAVRWPLKNRL